MPFLLTALFAQIVTSVAQTTSPSTAFLASPVDVTVPEGYPAVLKCKLKDPVHTCQWFYLDEGLDIFDVKNRPILVKEFRPAKQRDCSIKFSKTRTVQSGQWLCKGLQIHTRKYMVSEPALLKVLEATGVEDRDENVNKVDTSDPEATGTPFVSTEGYILTAEIDDPILLTCDIITKGSNCLWTGPNDRKIYMKNVTAVPTHENYYQRGRSIEGNCSLFLKNVREQDEGNWQCSTDEEWPIKGPIIHVHINGYHVHEDDYTEGNHLVPILVVVSIVLLVIIIALSIVIYRRVWGTHNMKPLESGRQTPNQNFRASFSEEGQQCLIYDTKQPSLAGSELSEVQIRAPDGTVYTKYLDMSGGSNRDSYVAFPDSNVDRASFNSRRTLMSSVHPGSDSGVDSINSGPPDSWAPKPPLDRTVSGCSEHLYEEIPEKHKIANAEERPLYTNLEVEEDKEGYMVPNRHSPNPVLTVSTPKGSTPKNSTPTTPNTRRAPLPAPPYSKVSDMGLVPSSQRSSKGEDDQPDTATTNPGYAMAAIEPLENYDIPRSSPVPSIGENNMYLNVDDNPPEIPERSDSTDNPLANYDVPGGTPVRSNTPNLMT